MKAIVRETYGSPDVLRLDDVPPPTLKDDGVLVRVHAASANAGDWHLLRGTPAPLRLFAGLVNPKHKVIGSDIAGTVESVGPRVTRLKPGDEVFGELSRCGFGGYAEYVVAPENTLALKPANLTFEEAAAVPTAGCTALQGLRKGRIHSARSVLIHGAGGGVGTFAVQIAKAWGAEVTGVCSTRNAEMIRSIGADHVLDYTRADFANLEKKYDLIVAVNGDRSIWDYKRALTPAGRYVMSGGSNRQLRDALLLGPVLSLGPQKLGNLLVRPNLSDLHVLKDLAEAGNLRPVIERRYELREVPDAIRHLESGHARGKLVVSIRQ